MKDLTPTEKLYMDTLIQNPDGLPTEELATLRPMDPIRASNLVAVNMKNLRKKLPEGYEIVNVRGWGYRLEKITKS